MKKFYLFSFLFLSLLSSHFLSANETASEKETAASSPLSPFTGKVSGSNVRLRVLPHLDAAIIRECEKGELVLVDQLKDEFFAIKPPKGTKLFVFRSYILDDTLEADRVNIRLAPSREAPIVAQLHSGDRVVGQISEENHKWLMIDPPENIRFYLAKDYVEKVAGPEHIVFMEKRAEEVKEKLARVQSLTMQESIRPFEQMQAEKVSKDYKEIIENYTDFSNEVEIAQKELASFQENYTQKRIAHLEKKAKMADEMQKMAQKEELLSFSVNADDRKESEEEAPSAIHVIHVNDEEELSIAARSPSPSERNFQVIQEGDEKTVSLRGIVRPFTMSVKNKPGDFILESPLDRVPIAYLYSSQVNLEQLVDQEVSLVGLERSNKNFAYPAYQVITTQ